MTISQTAYAGGYIDNVGLADYLDPHLDFEKTWDNSAKITVKSYFDYPVIVKLVFIERYKDPYTGRIRAATYYRNITINCKYQAPDPSQKVTKVILPERVRVPVDNSVLLEPVYEPTGSKPNIAKWTKEYGGFTPIGTEDGCCRINGKVIGIGKLSVQIDNSSSPDMNASTIVEIVDPNNLPPVNVFLPSSKEISVNGHCTLEPILVPEDAATAFTWSSSNNNIASVSYGKVTGKKAGTVTITVKTTNELEATCSVTVVNSGGKDDEDDTGDNTSGSIDGHGYIDLGLSVKWATCNVGSSSPEGFGGYYAWGETTEKSTYSWNTYLYSGNNAMDVYFIGNDIKGTQYDAAYVNWGKNWRMPTETEIGELIAKCTIEKKNQSGVDGYLVTGPNGSSIFLPKAGEKTDTYYSGFTRYWSSTANGEKAKCLLIDSQQRGTIQSQYRFKGLPIRAVTEGTSAPPTPLPKLTLSASPSGGQVSAGTTVTLTAKAEGSTVSGCDIYYTTNGSTPSKSSTKYTSSGVTINSNCTLKAIAYKDGYETSEVLEENYTIKSSNIDPTAIDVSPSSKTIKVGETFYCSYTLTPSNATTTVTWYSDNSNIASVNSSGMVTGVSTGYTYINAKTANGKEDWCKVTVESNPNPKLSLSASPSGGGVAKGTIVTLTAKANGSTIYGCDIYYTTNGSTPTKSSTKYTSSGITINSNCTLKAIAYKDGYETSDVLTTSYTINPSKKIYLIASPSGGSVPKGTVVKLYPKDKIDDDPGNMNDVLADIYYTLDGTTPTKNSIKYTSSGIAINNNCTLKAIGFSVWNGWMDSDVLTEYYTIMSDNPDPTGIEVSPSSKTIKVGETFYCSYTLIPSNATTTVTWYSDNSSVASVSSSGKVTGVSVGTTYINAKTANGKENWCKVTVESNPNPKIVLSVSPSGGQVPKGTVLRFSVVYPDYPEYGNFATIYYTIDGSTPTERSTAYAWLGSSTGIVVNNDLTLKAIALPWIGSYSESDMLIEYYTVGGSSGVVSTPVSTEPEDNRNIYNLHGQKVDKPVKGLYIVNGRKMLVK